MSPTRAMVLAAGEGTRMRPHTQDLPKPLIEVAGRTLIDRALDRLAAAGIAEVVVNTCYLAERIEAHLGRREQPRIVFSREAERLETGGGVNKALPLLGAGPFYVVNADVIWLDGWRPTLEQLARAWREGAMDALLLLQRTVTAFGYRGRGDFDLDPLGRVTRRAERAVSPFLFTGIQILHPRLFDGAPEGPFSLNLLYDRAAAAGRLCGIVHDGDWFHVGTPEALAEAEAELTHGPGARALRFP